MPFPRSILAASCFLLISAFTFEATARVPGDSYENGNTAYENGKYDQAIRLYQKSVRDGLVSEDLYYNLGNAFFKQENYGEAALWYRRALILDPRMPEPRQNLNTVKTRVGLLEFEPRGVEKFLVHFRESELLSIFTFAFWLSLLCLASLLFIKRLQPWRPLLAISTCLLAGLAVTSITGLQLYRSQIAVDYRAVVTAAGATAQTSPVPDAKTVIELPPGSEVRIVNDNGPWQYVDIPGELRGWVRTEAVTSLWPPFLPESGPRVTQSGASDQSRAPEITQAP